MEPAMLSRPALKRLQAERLARLLDEILPSNRFYAAKLSTMKTRDLRHLPFTTKAELVADQQANPPYGTRLTYPTERYTRLHQTSGTHGAPLR